jgi:hypothetical protein
MIGIGLPMGMLIRAYMGPMAITGLLGAASAAGSVALAKRGDEMLLEGDPDLPMLEDG